MATAQSGEAVITPAGNGSLPAGFSAVQLANALAAMPVKLDEVSASSRDARHGVAFLAYPGMSRDGREFIDDAIARGASAVLFDPEGFAWRDAWKVPHLGVPQLKAHASQIAGHVYGHAAEALWMVGVTGTNGKTSVAQWLAQGLAEAGRPGAVIGTIGHGMGGTLSPSDNTTPDAVTLQRLLRDYLRQGATSCVMEVSSHGLDQGRVADLKYDVAVFTNLTRDHLDYHGTMQAYGAAKARLFSMRGVKHAVINVDDEFGHTLAASLDRTAGLNVLRYGLADRARATDLAASAIAATASGLSFRVAGRFGEVRVASPALGDFNVYNLLAVIGALVASGVALEDAAGLAARLRPVPGRMQTLRVPGKPLVVVDYAHTPDALEKALSTLRALVPQGGRLISVFGCGGNRDRGKRALMGAVSARLADSTVLTSDNPRREPPLDIIADIEQGMRGANYRTVPGRQEAIFEALNAAHAADIVLVAGKGHEDYQILGEEHQPFSDIEVARDALAAWTGGGR
ncbi:MAG TPA: UDP-N-acetylmuramoyl-L-alanyl-D-glutamate--2,6-diaminopimelate ligase [Usitatibacteraceae bacterium]|nr:UDP-N-acetylmuramoyl-L-alanyl-D-glutamate--2,6-diaminopimelate ligase [Usitatibacteraceae bacterium]